MRAQEEAGYTLLELLIVVSLLALIAAVATPALTKTNESKLEIAASEVASAIRFGHSEAIRTGVPHGVHADYFAKRIRIYRLPIPGTPIYDVRDPLTKQLYDLDFNANASDVSIDSVYFQFENFAFPTGFVEFSGGTGLPKYNDSGSIRMLETAYVKLSYDGTLRTIDISPMTGRVTVQ